MPLKVLPHLQHFVVQLHVILGTIFWCWIYAYSRLSSVADSECSHCIIMFCVSYYAVSVVCNNDTPHKLHVVAEYAELPLPAWESFNKKVSLYNSVWSVMAMYIYQLIFGTLINWM